MQLTQQTIDPTVVALMHGLKMQEGGGTINYNVIGDGGTAAGAGQWSNQVNGTPVKLQQGQIPANFQSAAKTYGLNPTDFSPDNQNKVLYAEISAGKQKGLSPEQILSAHNSGDPNAYLSGNTGYNSSIGSSYDTGAYVKQAMAYAQKYVAQNNSTSIAPIASAADGSQTPQSPSLAGFIGNAVSSTGNLIGGIANAVIHPVQTAENLANTVQGGVENASNALLGTQFNDQSTQTAGNVGHYFAQRYGGSNPLEVAQNILKTAYNDPAGTALDLSTLLTGAGGALGVAGKVGDLADAARAGDISNVAKVGATTPTLGALGKTGAAISSAGDYLNPITAVTKTVGGAANLAGQAGLGFASKVIGEPAEVLVDLVKNPQDYSKASMEANSRGGLANEFGTAVDNIEAAKSATGSEYQGIRNSGAAVNISPDSIIQAFADNGLSVIKDATGKWKIANPTADTTLSKADVVHFKEFLDQFGKDKLDANQFLNARSKLSEYSNYAGKTNASTQLARDLRGTYDELGKQQIPGLNELDTKMAPQLQEWKGIKKEFLTKDPVTNEYTLKPNTASKLANALKSGKEPLVAKLEQIMPGITRKIEILKNIENIESKMGITVGSYTKSGLEIAGVATGNIPLAVGMIIAHPAIANQILRGLGFVGKAAVVPVLERVRGLIGALPKGTVKNTAKTAVTINQAANKPQGK